MNISLFHRLFACIVFDKPQYFVVHGFAARLAEMDGHAVIGRADTLCETALFTWHLLLLSGRGCLHSIGSFLFGCCSDIVVVGYHLFLWGICPCDFSWV